MQYNFINLSQRFFTYLTNILKQTLKDIINKILYSFNLIEEKNSTHKYESIPNFEEV